MAIQTSPATFNERIVWPNTVGNIGQPKNLLRVQSCYC